MKSVLEILRVAKGATAKNLRSYHEQLEASLAATRQAMAEKDAAYRTALLEGTDDDVVAIENSIAQLRRDEQRHARAIEEVLARIVDAERRDLERRVERV